MKAKVFHAGRGMWEVRYKKGGRTFGVGHFFPKLDAQRIARNLNKMKGRK